MSWVCSAQASTEVYSPSWVLASRSQAVNSNGAAPISNSAACLDRFIGSPSLSTEPDDAWFHAETEIAGSAQTHASAAPGRRIA